MNVAQLQLALGRLSSPAAAEKPDLAGYEAQGESLGWGSSSSTAADPRASESEGVAGGLRGGGRGRAQAPAGAESGALPPNGTRSSRAARLEKGSLRCCAGFLGSVST